MQDKKQQLEWDMEQLTGSKLGKKYVKTGKEVRQNYTSSPWLFTLYADCTMQNAGLDEAEAGIKIARRSISNLRYADDTTLVAERERN